MRGLDEADLAVVPAYVQAVADRVQRVRHVSRWLNAVSVEASEGQIGALAALPFVARLDLVTTGRRPPEPAVTSAATPGRTRGRHLSGIDYGLSEEQVAQIQVPVIHDLGLHGEGVVVAVFDTGFEAHESLATAQILAARDFVNGDDDVRSGADRGDGSHGTATLSVLGGYMPGQLVGPAFASTFILAKTEDTWSETPVEEDHWAAAAEWVEALGADVISSSLGYLEFDFGQPSHTPADMNGAIAVSTRAADLAAERGIVVVNSAGNAGLSLEHNTLGAPADGLRVLAIAAVDRDRRARVLQLRGTHARRKDQARPRGAGRLHAGGQHRRVLPLSGGQRHVVLLPPRRRGGGPGPAGAPRVHSGPGPLRPPVHRQPGREPRPPARMGHRQRPRRHCGRGAAALVRSPSHTPRDAPPAAPGQP